jgi:hypothetical protein
LIVICPSLAGGPQRPACSGSRPLGRRPRTPGAAPPQSSSPTPLHQPGIDVGVGGSASRSLLAPARGLLVFARKVSARAMPNAGAHNEGAENCTRMGAATDIAGCCGALAAGVHSRTQHVRDHLAPSRRHPRTMRSRVRVSSAHVARESLARVIAGRRRTRAVVVAREVPMNDASSLRSAPQPRARRASGRAGSTWRSPAAPATSPATKGTSASGNRPVRGDGHAQGRRYVRGHRSDLRAGRDRAHGDGGHGVDSRAPLDRPGRAP